MFHSNINSVPINSLTYKCLSALDNQASFCSSINKQPPPEKTINTDLKATPTKQTITKTTPLPVKIITKPSIYCNIDGNDGPGQVPIDIKQEIIDHLVQERIPVSARFLCQLLSNGGVYSLDLWQICYDNQFNETEMIDILTKLKNNASNLRELTLGGHTWIYKRRVVEGPMRKIFQENVLTKLKSLKLQQTSSPDELIAILKACPNLVKLEICQPSLTCKQITVVANELQNVAYHKIRSTLRELRLPQSVRKAGIIKMIALFPNLLYLNCCHYENVLEAIDFGDDRLDINEIRKVSTILQGLQGLTITHPIGRDAVSSLVARSPNLQELVLEVDAHMMLSPISTLKYLKRLDLHNSQSSPASFLQQVLPILQQLGDSLDALGLESFDVVDLSTCARYCPNLKHFSGQWFTILSCTQTTPGLTIPRKERQNLKKPFAHLQTLRLRPRSQRNVPVSAIGYILTNARDIHSIELYSCPDLTDEHLLSLIKNNSLRKLRSLILRHGHCLTKSCLNRLVNSLESLSCLDCGAPLLSKADLVPNDDEDDEASREIQMRAGRDG